MKGSPNVQYMVGETANGGNKLFVLLISNLISDSLSMILFQALATTIGGQIPWHGQTELREATMYKGFRTDLPTQCWTSEVPKAAGNS